MLNKLKNMSLHVILMICLLILFDASYLFAADVALSWNPPITNKDGSPLTDLSGYVIYYGTESGNYTQSIDVGNMTNYLVTNLSAGQTYYISVTAYDTSNNESEHSNEVSTTIGPSNTIPANYFTGDIDGSGQDDIIIDFGPGTGIWIWYNDDNWIELHPSSSENIALGDMDNNGKDEIIIDFGASGIWVRYNDTAWSKLHSLSAASMTTGDIDGSGQDDIIIDFGPGIGIWIWYNDDNWNKLHPSSPENIATGDMDGNGKDEIIIDFGASGIWVRYNDTTWSKLHSLSAASMTTGDIDGSGQNDIIIDFGPGTGIWIWYNDNNWIKL